MTRADPGAVADPDNWTGGFYELFLETGEDALPALWRATGAERVSEESGHVRGTVHLPLGGPVVCGSYAGIGGDGPDYVEFYLPLGALSQLDRRIGGFPFGPGGGATSLSWRAALDTWLAGVAEEVFREVGFTLGVIGFELDAVTAADLGGVVPDARWEGYLLPVDGDLKYWPANR